jgi:ATP-binding cassette subfamily B protein
VSFNTDSPVSQRAGLGWLRPYIRPHFWKLASVAVLAILISALAVAQPYLSKWVIDEGLIGRQINVVIRLCCAIVALAAVGFALGALNRWLYVRVSGRVLFALREDVFAHLLKLPPAFFRKRSVGDLVTRLDGDVAEVQRFSIDTLLAVVNGTLMLVASSTIMIFLSPVLALVAACALPLQLLVRHRARRPISEATRAVREQTSRVAGFFVETLGAAKAVQGAVAESWEQKRLGTLNEGLLRRLLRQQLVGYCVGGISSLLSHATTAAVFIAGGFRVMQGDLTVGTLIAFTAYLTRGTGSAASLMNLYTAYQRAAVSLARVRELLDAKPKDRLRGTGRVLCASAPGYVEFKEVSFRPPERDAPLFTTLSFDIPPGSKLVLCGDSGVGKSTLVDLLRGFVVPDSGDILLDRVSLEAYELGSVRRHIAVIEAEPVLFQGSIFHNLRYGSFAASDESVLEAARRAGVATFVARMPRGYETELGPCGVGLSTGQRQRIAIARALLGDPVLIILDEATSNLDASAARSMHELIDTHFAHRTRVIITHAPDRVPDADTVLELRGGHLCAANHEVAHG